MVSALPLPEQLGHEVPDLLRIHRTRLLPGQPHVPAQLGVRRFQNRLLPYLLSYAGFYAIRRAKRYSEQLGPHQLRVLELQQHLQGLSSWIFGLFLLQLEQQEQPQEAPPLAGGARVEMGCKFPFIFGVIAAVGRDPQRSSHGI